MIVSKQALYYSCHHHHHYHHHLSIYIRGGGTISSSLQHSSSCRTRRKISRSNNVGYATALATHSFNFLNANLDSLGDYSCIKSVCNNAMNGTTNGICGQEEVLYEGGKERKVKCGVEVISWRERRIKSEVEVDADVDSVWNALTDYERLADFVPNLVLSARIPCPHPGRIWLEQRGLQRALLAY